MSATQTLADRISVITTLAHDVIRTMPVSTAIPFGSPEHKRIAALMPVETAEAQKAQSHVIFLMNFSDELRRKVPTGK